MLNVEWLKEPRSAHDLMRRCGPDYRDELRELAAQGHEVLMGEGQDINKTIRIFYWVTQERDTAKQRRRELMLGELEIRNARALLP